jgi:hypothetical protein
LIGIIRSIFFGHFADLVNAVRNPCKGIISNGVKETENPDKNLMVHFPGFFVRTSFNKTKACMVISFMTDKGGGEDR